MKGFIEFMIINNYIFTAIIIYGSYYMICINISASSIFTNK